MVYIKKFYITTAIPYVNADPHIGHALEFIQTDCITRYNRINNIPTFLTTGSDENSLKNVQAAEERKITVKELCDVNSYKFKQLALALNISFDNFLRSSDKSLHWPGVHKLWNLCDKSKDIYKKKYKGLYCVGCEAFYTENELVNGLCSEHMKKPVEIEEENYFFRLSKYQKQLEKIIENDEVKIYPESRKNEVLSFIRSGLDDFSVSRSVERAKGWGVPVPNDSTQMIYVWFDALDVYMTSVGYSIDDKKFKKWWPCDLHVIGKGIIRFHAIYWLAMLLSAGIKLPKAIFVHGYITVEGQKMSKTLGNVVNPINIIEKYGSDSLRYFMLKEISPFDDGDFSEKELVQKHNSELVANYSNLFYRITSFIDKNFNGTVKGTVDKKMQAEFDKKIKFYNKAMSGYKIHEGLGIAMELSSLVNKYFQDEKPWETIKTNKKKCEKTLYNALKLLKEVTILLQPFIPNATEKALHLLKEKKTEMLFKTIETNDNHRDNISQRTEGLISMSHVSIEEFSKSGLTIGTIIDVKDHPNADKLYVITVDLGTEKRQIVAGIKITYTKEQLMGKQIVVVSNLEPAKLRGVESNGMLLATDDGILISPERNVKSGTKVR